METRHDGPAPEGPPKVIKMGLGTLRVIGSRYAKKVFLSCISCFTHLECSNNIATGTGILGLVNFLVNCLV